MRRPTGPRLVSDRTSQARGLGGQCVVGVAAVIGMSRWPVTSWFPRGHGTGEAKLRAADCSGEAQRVKRFCENDLHGRIRSVRLSTERGETSMASNLVIFDCDGVLVDSEPISNRVFRDMLNEIDIPVTLEYMYEHFVGLSMPKCMELVAQLRGRPVPEGFLERLQHRTEEELRATVQPMLGIHDVLDGLTLPYCVASSGAHSKIRTTLGATGLLDRFAGRVFSGQDVSRPKPAPDLFLHAAATLGHSPERCLVIEDTPTGVRAGVAAGMRVFGFDAFTPTERLVDAGAHTTFRSMRELPGLIDHWSKGVR